MKILAIGNSFSQDAMTYMEDIAESCGRTDIIAANLYIGGCPLTKHAENLKTDELEYDYQIRGKGLYKTSIHAALLSDDWDVITMQQVSGDSGLYDTYHPYIDYVYAEVKRLCPNAKVLLHRTWAYEEKSNHGRFADYNRDRDTMDRMIEDTFQKISSEFGLDMIPCGNVVTAIKKTMPEFDIENGGASLYRDRFHMGNCYGRYVVACVWLKKVCGVDISKATFIPNEAYPPLIKKLNEFVANYEF